MTGIRHLVASRKKWPERSECIRAFSFDPLASALQLKTALGIVVVKGVATHKLESAVLRDVAGGLTDNYCQLHFPVQFLRVLRDRHGIVRANERRRGFHE